MLTKFGLCLNCSQKLDECSLAPARNILQLLAARIFAKIPYRLAGKHPLLQTGKQRGNMRDMNVSGKMLLRVFKFIDTDWLGVTSR